MIKILAITTLTFFAFKCCKADCENDLTDICVWDKSCEVRYYPCMGTPYGTNWCEVKK